MLNRLIRLMIRCVVLLLLLPMMSYGQDAQFEGLVSHQSGVALGYASVQLDGTDLGAITDGNGRYVIRGIPPGDYTITVSYLGCMTQKDKVSLVDGQVLVKTYELHEDALNLDGVVVSGTRYASDRVNNPIVVGVIDNNLLQATQAMAISEGLNYQPGVRVETNCQNCGFTQVRLNGLEGGYAQILINSRPIFSALNSVYGLDQIPANLVERIEVVRGGGSALYGSNAIAGTVNIITRDPIENSWQIHSNTALVDGEALDRTLSFNGSVVNEALSRGVTIYGMWRDRDGYDANDDGFTELVDLENRVLGMKAFLKPGKRSKLTLDFSMLHEDRRGGDHLDLPPHFTDITEELDHQTYLGGVNYELWSGDGHGKFSLYFSAQGTQRDSYYGGLGGGRTLADSTLASLAYGHTDDFALVAGAQYTRYFGDDGVLTAGLEHQHYDTQDEISGYYRLIDQKVHTSGLFAQFEWKPSERITALLGGRFDISDVDGLYNLGTIERRSEVNIGVFNPRITLLYKLLDNFRIRGSYARGFRAPQAFNEDLHISSVAGEPLFVILSDDLDKETSDAYTASLNYTRSKAGRQLNLLLEGFYTELHDPFTQVSLGTILPNGSILEEVQNGAGAIVSGINIEAGYVPHSRFAIQFGGTAQRTHYRERQEIFAPEDHDGDVITVDHFIRTPELYGYLTSYYYTPYGIKLDLTSTYTGGMVVPRVTGADGALELLDTHPFVDVNVKASYKWDISNAFDLELSAGVRNVFNSYQSDFDEGPMRDSDFIYGPMSPRSIFFSVKIGDFP